LARRADETQRLQKEELTQRREVLLGGWHEKSELASPNVRAKRATTAGRQARAGENVRSTTGPGLVACRWRSA